jgi:hypothetical protein
MAAQKRNAERDHRPRRSEGRQCVPRELEGRGVSLDSLSALTVVRIPPEGPAYRSRAAQQQ